RLARWPLPLAAHALRAERAARDARPRAARNPERRLVRPRGGRALARCTRRRRVVALGQSALSPPESAARPPCAARLRMGCRRRLRASRRLVHAGLPRRRVDCRREGRRREPRHARLRERAVRRLALARPPRAAREDRLRRTLRAP